MFNTGTNSSSLIKLQSPQASLLLVTLCMYVAGLVLAYIAFLLDRQAAIQSVRSGISNESRAITHIRSTRMTSSDRREALIAAAIWPALLLARFASPVWVVGRLYRDGQSKAKFAA